MSRIKEYPSITSFDGTNDALAIEQTDGANNRTRKVSPAQLKQYIADDVLDGSKIAILHQRYTNVNINSAWGSLYISDLLNFDTSALGLQSAPKSVSLAVESCTSTVVIVINNINVGNIKFYMLRPNSATNVTVNISALIVY